MSKELLRVNYRIFRQINRFEIIAGITGSKKLLFLEKGKLTTYASQENTEFEKIEYSNNPVFDIYLELFNAVKDKF
jgi:hypothetical protein